MSLDDLQKLETAAEKKAKTNKDESIIELLVEIRDLLDSNRTYRK